MQNRSKCDAQNACHGPWTSLDKETEQPKVQKAQTPRWCSHAVPIISSATSTQKCQTHSHWALKTKEEEDGESKVERNSSKLSFQTTWIHPVCFFFLFVKSLL